MLRYQGKLSLFYPSSLILEVSIVAQTEIKLYLERARTALRQSRDNMAWGYYDITTSRAYYAMFYAATALLLA